MNWNRVTLGGYLTRNVKLSYTPNQVAVAEFGVASNRSWTTATGEKKQEACFIECRAFGKTAETLAKYMAKGKPIFIEGRLCYESWTGKDGTKRSSVKVVVEQFRFVGSSQDKPSEVPSQGPGETPPQAMQPEESVGHAVPGSDDDIPF